MFERVPQRPRRQLAISTGKGLLRVVDPIRSGLPSSWARGLQIHAEYLSLSTLCFILLVQSAAVAVHDC